MVTRKGVAGFTILLALCVIVFGAYVRLTDAGLGCPDWPGCYGFVTVPQTAEDYLSVEQNFPGEKSRRNSLRFAEPHQPIWEQSDFRRNLAGFQMISRCPRDCGRRSGVVPEV